MALLHLLTLNIERDEHLDRVAPFLEKQKPDVWCVQELLEKDIPLFERILGAKCFYIPALRWSFEQGMVEGLGIYTSLPSSQFKVQLYAGNTGDIMVYDGKDDATMRATQKFNLATIVVEKEGVQFKIGNTHFTWSPDGKPTDLQRRDVQALLDALKNEGELVLTGDFNAPRGGEIFSAIAANYKDNVPSHYNSSIDGTLHRAGALNFMVDGIFSTPQYDVTNVEMRCGVSDHCALSAQVSLK
ncbi:MAG TPA: endonuclease/exonuclease/phosphatase family protein [Candidatus Paceibacterota bacterium]|nr:endonuclease/exonuclease/phosphatase family protein [Candidatus Paceibacterota bacterium]